MTSERPKVGDRVRVVMEGTVHLDDESKDCPIAVRRDGSEIWIWVQLDEITVLPEAPIRPKVGDRVRYRYYSSAIKPDEDARRGRTGVIVEDDKSSVPFNIKEEGTGHRHWATEKDVEVLPEQSMTERSDTAIERRLVELERAVADQTGTNTRYGDRISVLERQVTSLFGDLKHWSDNSQGRLTKLERASEASLASSQLHLAREVTLAANTDALAEQQRESAERITALEREVELHRQTLSAFTVEANAQQRLAVLERQMAALRSALHAAGTV